MGEGQWESERAGGMEQRNGQSTWRLSYRKGEEEWTGTKRGKGTKGWRLRAIAICITSVFFARDSVNTFDCLKFTFTFDQNQCTF